MSRPAELGSEDPGWEEIWETFLRAERTLGPSPGLREAWHRGRPEYCVWIARVQAAWLRERVASAQERLSAWIDPVPLEDLHITLWVSGFPQAVCRWDDDVPLDLLRRQEAALQGQSACRVQLGRPSAFLSCAILEVLDCEGGIASLRSALNLGQELRFERYRPHITLGTFRGDLPTEPIARVIRDLAQGSGEALMLDAVDRVGLDPARAGAPLITRARVELSPPRTS